MLSRLTTITKLEYTQNWMERYDYTEADLNVPEERDLSDEPFFGDDWGQPYLEAPWTSKQSVVNGTPSKPSREATQTGKQRDLTQRSSVTNLP